MAGDWIKMRTDLYRDPKVVVIADRLMDHESELSKFVSQNCGRDMSVTRNVTRCVTVGALVAVWGVARHQGYRDGDDLRIDNVTLMVIDDIAEIPGFGEAMEAAGWLEQDDAGLCFPRFYAEHNVDPRDAKREKDRERQRRKRERDKQCDNSVTEGVTVTHREEKRREENTKTGTGSRAGIFSNVDRNTLKDDGRLKAWFDETVKSPSPPVRDTDRDLLFVFACAERALSKGKNPAALFATLVGKRLENVSGDEEDRARDRIRKLRSRAPPPDASLVGGIGQAPAPSESLSREEAQRRLREFEMKNRKGTA